MALTTEQQDCRNVLIYFEVFLKKLRRGDIPDEHDLRNYKDQLEKIKRCFEVEGCQNTSVTTN